MDRLLLVGRELLRKAGGVAYSMDSVDDWQSLYHSSSMVGVCPYPTRQSKMICSICAPVLVGKRNGASCTMANHVSVSRKRRHFLQGRTNVETKALSGRPKEFAKVGSMVYAPLVAWGIILRGWRAK